MAVNPPPIQEKTTEQNGLFPQTWLAWFTSIKSCFDDLTGRVDVLENDFSSTGSGGIINGGRRMTGSSFLLGGRRV